MKKLTNKELYYKIGKENLWKDSIYTCKISKKQDLSDCSKKDCGNCRHIISKSELIDWIRGDFE